MITTLTPNPCIDKTVAVEKFDIYKMNRVRVLRTDACGKGINVSLALNGLGVETMTIGFDFTDGHASPLKQSMAAHNIPYEFIDVPGQLRVCTKIFDESLKHTIEVNEYGAPVSAEAGEKLLRLVVDVAKKSDFITLSGSLPKGLDSDFYFRCVQAVKQEVPNCKVVVDAEKQLLLKALEASPFFIKPNIHEFQGTFNCQINSIDELDKAAQDIIRRYGLGLICISMGADGAYIGSPDGAYTCNAVKVDVRSIQGAGDSMVAGICTAVQRGLPLNDILRYGVTASGASISREGSQMCTLEDFQALLTQDIAMRKIR